jgi:hypothetical protein
MPVWRRFGRQNSAFAAFMARAVPRGVLGALTRAFCPRFCCHKILKSGSCPFPKQGDVDTYPSHPTAMPGLPSQEASGRDRSAPYTRWPGSFRVRFSKAMQRFNAGWSSPVARQAHNLKVIGSNPIPATKIDAKSPAISIDCWAFVFVVEPSSRQKSMVWFRRFKSQPIPCSLNEISRGLPRGYPDQALRRGSGFDETGNVSARS